MNPEINWEEPYHALECSRFCSCNKMTCRLSLISTRDYPNCGVKHLDQGAFLVERVRKSARGEEAVMWGLKATRFIRVGSFVMEYTGEVREGISEGDN